jgi:hypothetical protein
MQDFAGMLTNTYDNLNGEVTVRTDQIKADNSGNLTGIITYNQHDYPITVLANGDVQSPDIMQNMTSNFRMRQICWGTICVCTDGCATWPEANWLCRYCVLTAWDWKVGHGLARIVAVAHSNELQWPFVQGLD